MLKTFRVENIFRIKNILRGSPAMGTNPENITNPGIFLKLSNLTRANNEPSRIIYSEDVNKKVSWKPSLTPYLMSC